MSRSLHSLTFSVTAAILLFFTSGELDAGSIVYTSQADFNAANSTPALVDFENFGVSNSFSDPSAVAFPAGPFGPSSLSSQGVTFSSSGVTGGFISSSGPVVTDTRSAVNVFGPDYQGYRNAGSAYLVSEISRSSLTLNFATAQSAVGLDVGTLLPPLLPGQDPSQFFGSNRTFDLVFDFGAEGSYTATFDTWQFVGFQFDAPISTFTISFADGPASALYPNSSNYIGIDNLMFNDSTGESAPLPSSLPIGLGLLCSFYLLRALLRSWRTSDYRQHGGSLSV